MRAGYVSSLYMRSQSIDKASISIFLHSCALHLLTSIGGGKDLTSRGLLTTTWGVEQAISMKQTVLIEVLSSAPLRKSETSDDTSVHHVSPRIEGVGEETIQSGVDEDDIGSRAGLNSDIL